MGRLGLPINAIASAWGLFVVLNIAWPRVEIYGPDRWGRFAALLWTLGLLVAGGLYYAIFQRRRRSETLSEHRPDSAQAGPTLAAAGPAIEAHWIGRLAAND
jgi:hypothetical protein